MVRGIPSNLVLDRSFKTTMGHHSSPQRFNSQPHNNNVPSLVSEGFVALSFTLLISSLLSTNQHKEETSW